MPSSDAGATVMLALGHFLTFAFCGAAPILGFFLWKYMDKEESHFSSTALVGWLVGIALLIMRISMRGAAVASH